MGHWLRGVLASRSIRRGRSGPLAAGLLGLAAAVGPGVLARPLYPHPAVHVGEQTLAAVSADLNGDGHADLLVTQNFDYSFAVLLGDGDGTFAPSVHYPPQLWELTYSLVPAVGDFDADGQPSRSRRTPERRGSPTASPSSWVRGTGPSVLRICTT
jgi:hypothetical protein